MKRLQISPHREKVLDFIRQSAEEGSVPSRQEIQKYCRFKSPHAVTYHLGRLMRDGYITLKEGVARSIQLTDKAMGIPILGRVPAGPAQEAIEDVEGYITHLPSAAFRHKLFALRVKGDSMIDAHIAEGDLVIVESWHTPEHGDIVVARIDSDQTTVKEFRRNGSTMELMPANPKYQPIPIDENVQIIGKVIEVRRTYR